MTEPIRTKLSVSRQSITHRFEIQDAKSGVHEIYLTVGLFEDGSPGELFVKTGKWGSTLNGLLDVIGIQTSYLLQYGIPLERISHKLIGMQFEPAGSTDNPDIPTCQSVIDYIFRWMQSHFPQGVE